MKKKTMTQASSATLLLENNFSNSAGGLDL